jgi:biotin transport system substrate-specific component
VTLQTFFVLLAGMLLGASSGAASQIVYLAAGTAGLPVFAGGSGPSALLGPTGGYLVGFVPAAWVSGRLVRARLGRSWVGAFLTALLATGVVLLLGGIHRTLFHDAGLAASLLPGGPILLAANVAKAAAAAAVWRGSRRFAPPGSP